MFSAKIPRHTRQNAITEGDLECILTRNCEGTSRKVTWSSSAPSVVSVNKKGKITARRTGKATITAKVNGVKYKCKVTVKARSKKSSGSSGQSSGKSSGQASSSGVNGYVWIPAT